MIFYIAETFILLKEIKLWQMLCSLQYSFQCKIQKNWCIVTAAPTKEHHGGHSLTPANQRWDLVPGKSICKYKFGCHSSVLLADNEPPALISAKSDRTYVLSTCAIKIVLGIEFYLFVSHGGMNDRGSTCKFRNARKLFRFGYEISVLKYTTGRYSRMFLHGKMDVKIFLMFIVAENTGSVNICTYRSTDRIFLCIFSSSTNDACISRILYSGHLVLSHFWTCKCSNVETNISWTCLVSGLLSFEHPSVLLFLPFNLRAISYW